MFSYINKLRFGYESKLFMQLNLNNIVSRAVTDLSLSNDFNYHKRYILGSAVKITPSLIPDLYNLYQDCLKFVGGDLKGDLYVQQQSSYNAYVYAVNNNKFDITLSSQVVKDFKPKEIAFVIGHELGHVIFEHNKIPVNLILDKYTGISYEIASLLFQWSKAAEISADRIGLLCSGSLASGANVFFKVSSGLLLDREDEIISSLRSQFEEIKALSAWQTSAENLICTHPMIPIRFKSLELINLDILFLRNRGAKAECPGFDSIDAQIKDVLTKTEPLGLGEFLSTKEGVSILILCLLYVAVSDGDLNKFEENFIYDIRNRAKLDISSEEVISVCRKEPQSFKSLALLDISSAKISQDDVGKIIQLCHYLAIVDVQICNAEIDAMKEICSRLGADVWIVDSVINQSSHM